MGNLRFTKMHGCGNDYIYINCFEEQVEDPAALAVRLSDRHKGIGGDGVILICPSGVADAKMRMFNLDGSEGKMCGNGIRCVAKYVFDHRIAHKEELRIETLSGIKTCRVHAENGQAVSVTVDMGDAILTPGEIPVELPGERVVGQNVEVAGGIYEITCVSMGNPHCVIFGDGPRRAGPAGDRPPVRARPPVPPGGEHRVHPGAGQPHLEDAGVGAGQRRDHGLRHRRLRQRCGGHPLRPLQRRGGHCGKAARRGFDHPRGGQPRVDDRRSRHRV